LKDQTQDLQHRLTQAESRASKLFDANAQMQRSVDELEQANATLNLDSAVDRLEDVLTF